MSMPDRISRGGSGFARLLLFQPDAGHRQKHHSAPQASPRIPPDASASSVPRSLPLRLGMETLVKLIERPHQRRAQEQTSSAVFITLRQGFFRRNPTNRHSDAECEEADMIDLVLVLELRSRRAGNWTDWTARKGQ